MREAYGIEAPVLPRRTPWTRPRRRNPSRPRGWQDYHLVVSRLLPYKNVEAVVEAFRDLPERLVVVGHGPLRRSLERRLPPNVRLLSDLTDGQLRWVYAHSSALVAPPSRTTGSPRWRPPAYGSRPWRSAPAATSTRSSRA
jgi:glycosyltransferase involved in cell wall biosynthesis